MSALSAGATLVWEVAAVEAAAGDYATIEPAHLALGLCSLDKALGTEGLADRLEPDDVGVARREADTIDGFLRHGGVRPDVLRRALREHLGRGSGLLADRVVRRSSVTKALFDRADHLAHAVGRERTEAVHLLAVVLDAAPKVLETALVQQGSACGRLRAALEPVIAATCPVPGPVPDPPPPVPPTIPPMPLPAPGPEPYRPPTPLLDRFGRDLTREAAEGRLRPVIGRRGEMLQALRVLTRSTKNNPVLIGEPGVGKTAVVEGLAQRIADEQAAPLAGRRIVELKLAALVAGTRYRGDFEERLTGLLDEARAHPEVILFIDELHTVIAAGDSEGGLDVANILKPALARGDLTCIGATTEAEYRRHIARDAALERRFQPVRVPEPAPDEAREMLAGLVARLEAHHGVVIEPDAVAAAVDLTVRFLTGRRLPDKALDALDEACARVRVPTLSQPFGAAGTEPPTVTACAVAEVVQQWTGVPVRASEADTARLRGLEAALGRRVVGQPEAVERVAGRIRRASAGLADPQRPLGVFLFVGPTGVGKTALARALAEEIFGSEAALIRLDMSEYSEKHDVAKLIGAPPGYVGHGEAGVLVRRLRETPYAVVLLDEVEKAHPDIFDVFLQVFDAGRLTDGTGATVDARHAVFIMTSNLQPPPVPRRLGFGAAAAAAAADTPAADAEVRRFFRPEFVNRIDAIVPFRRLGPEQIAEVARARLSVFAERLRRERHVTLDVTDDAVALLARLGHDTRSGARELARVIERMVEEPLADQIVAGTLRSGERVALRVAGDRLVFARDFGTI